MGQYTFSEIKRRIFVWSQKDILKYMLKQDGIEISRNNDEILLIDFTFENCLAQLLVSTPPFAPYHFVSFEAMTFDSEKAQTTGKPEIVYFFYDSIDMSEKEVINALEIAIKYCSSYIPNYLNKLYINKGGMLAIKSENICYTVHPDDINKVNSEIINSQFICTDVEAQYLVVKKDMLSLRILPQVFNVI